ncbi:MAG: prepilin-type N-terminal cleavage/methylation domain-containing protein [Planctomycetaceae bacterium]|nr:prepilin-type N-terminal cleavage/methylation domain-containing protein [Planctomycetaceae bacterium]
MALGQWAGGSPALPVSLSPFAPREGVRQFPNRRGFSLVEAMAAITVLALAGAVLILAVETSMQTTTDAVDRTIADGLAQQLMDEISLKHFMEPGTSCTDPLGPSGWENAGSGRGRFNDTDDYEGFQAVPAEGIWGEPLGTGSGDGTVRYAAFQVPANYFASWRQRVEVYFVDPSNPSLRLTSGTSEYRAIEVTIARLDDEGNARPLASRKKVIAYVPPPTY